MSDSTSDGPNGTVDPRSPDQIAREARNTALEELDAAAGMDNVADRAQAEQKAAVAFADEMAVAIGKGLSKAHARSACGQLSDAAKYYTKSDLADLIQEATSDLDNEADGRRPFDEILEDELNEVVIVRTTDAKQGTIYRWQFAGASVETKATSEGRTHFHWTDFRDEYFDALGEDPAKPTQERQGGEEWREFIVGLVEDRGREVTTRGPRSSAVDGLKNFIRRSRAYGDIEHMVERDGLYLDEPLEEDPSELWVPNHEVKRISDDHELSTVRELQLELDARGYTRNRIAGVSESTFVNNNKVTYWVLDAGIAEPAEYLDEPMDPAEQVRQEEQEKEGDEDDDYEPGPIGAVGDDPDSGDGDE